MAAPTEALVFALNWAKPASLKGGSSGFSAKATAVASLKPSHLTKVAAQRCLIACFLTAGPRIHGSPQLSLMNSSHGCVRVTTPSAAWLSNSFIQVGTRGISDAICRWSLKKHWGTLPMASPHGKMHFVTVHGVEYAYAERPILLQI